MSLNLQNLSVLVVEDVKEMRNLFISLLEEMDIGKVYQAPDGERGFEVFQKFNPDIVFLDWEMPEVSGIALTRQIRRRNDSPNTMAPIIMITGYSSIYRVSEARDAGITEFIVKPFSAKDIIKRIETVINKPRDFIISDNYTGPDRRRRQVKLYKGPWRREEDNHKQ